VAPKFSLIVPVYKVETYLRACLDSIRNQTFGDWEAICVDDGSPDGCGKILDQYAEKDGRFKIIHQENRGVGEARNSGLEVASAEWVWFIDGDDMIVPRALQCLSEVLDNPQYTPLNSITFDFEWISEEMSPLGVGAVTLAKYSAANVDSALGRSFFGSACAKIFRKSAIGNQRFWRYRYNEDAAFVLDFSFRNKGWLLLDAKLYSYRKRPGSLTTSRFSKDDVALTFQQENWLLDKALEGCRVIPDAKLDELFKALQDRAFKTFSEGFYKLAAKERKELLPQWLAIQKRYMGVYPMTRKLRICIFLVGFFNSGLLVKPIVQGLARLNLIRHGIQSFWR